MRFVVAIALAMVIASVFARNAAVARDVATARGAAHPGEGRQGTAAPGRQEPSPTELAAAIDTLGKFDLAARTAASRVIRRASAARVTGPLTEAGRSHRDSYVRYRALVLLSGFDDPATGATMQALLADRDDRVRIVAASWFEHRPDRAVLPQLIARLEDEQSEYVRPALTRAIAAQAAEPAARAALLPLVTRGEDVFRSAAIVALGEAKAAFGAAAIRAVAGLDGPLQEDAIIALGASGDRASLPALSEIQRAGPRERQPAVAAAVCLLGLECPTQHKYLADLLKFSAGRDERMLRAAARALGALGVAGQREGFTPLFDVGVSAKDPERVPIALSLGLAALRNPSATLAALEPFGDRAGAILLIRDAFDLLSQEDFAQERFFRVVRQAYWESPAGSPRRALAEALIQGLEI